MNNVIPLNPPQSPLFRAAQALLDDANVDRGALLARLQAAYPNVAVATLDQDLRHAATMLVQV
jgi:hypothetical protein